MSSECSDGLRTELPISYGPNRRQLADKSAVPISNTWLVQAVLHWKTFHRDVFALGTCVLQVSQPRQPCWKLSRRWSLPKLAVQVQRTRRTGWYLRVIQEGAIVTGQAMRLIERPHSQWTIEAANEIMFAKPRSDG
ncbi:MAG: MOSC domain-containing protein [Rubripirellula sp.]